MFPFPEEFPAEDRCATPSEARAEYAANAGRERVEQAWVLTPWDTWEANPFYRGPAVRHPEADDYDDEAPDGCPVSIEDDPF